MRKAFIAANWKMQKTVEEALEFVGLLKEKIADARDVDVAICPPYTALGPVCDALADTGIFPGAQNMHWEDKGAFTGEVSATMLVSIGCKYVILGHSERRQYFHETNEIVKSKLLKALSSGLNSILCVGETLEERKAGGTHEKVSNQIRSAFEGLPPEDCTRITIAYEPIWAIGTGLTASPDQAEEVHSSIRGMISDLLGKETGREIRIQYGGSVKPENVGSLMAQPDIDGALVGGASLDVDSFARIIQFNTGG